jgi:hypothetical protein
MSYPIAERPLWVPDTARIADANITAFTRQAEARWGRSCPITPRCMGGPSISPPSSGRRSGNTAR